QDPAQREERLDQGDARGAGERQGVGVSGQHVGHLHPRHLSATLTEAGAERILERPRPSEGVREGLWSPRMGAPRTPWRNDILSDGPTEAARPSEADDRP